MARMKLSSLFILFLIVILTNSCTKFTPPKDFGFVLKFGFVDMVSSLDSSFTRRYINGSKIAKVIFTDDEKKDLVAFLKTL